MSNKFEEEVSKERYNANCKRFQLVNSNKDAFSIEMVRKHENDFIEI